MSCIKVCMEHKLIRILDDSGVIGVKDIVNALNVSFHIDTNRVEAVGNHEGHLTVILNGDDYEDLKRNAKNIYLLWSCLDDGYCTIYHNKIDEDTILYES